MREYYCRNDFNHPVLGLQNCGYDYGGTIGRLQCESCKSQSEAYAEGEKKGYNSGVHDTVIACAEKPVNEELLREIIKMTEIYIQSDIEYLACIGLGYFAEKFDKLIREIKTKLNVVDKESIMSVEPTLKK